MVFKKTSLPTNVLYQNLIVMFLTKVFELSYNMLGNIYGNLINITERISYDSIVKITNRTDILTCLLFLWEYSRGTFYTLFFICFKYGYHQIFSISTLENVQENSLRKRYIILKIAECLSCHHMSNPLIYLTWGTHSSTGLYFHLNILIMLMCNYSILFSFHLLPAFIWF